MEKKIIFTLNNIGGSFKEINDNFCNFISLLSPVKVQAEKEKFMSSLPGSVSNLPKPTQNLFNYVKNLEFTVKMEFTIIHW